MLRSGSLLEDVGSYSGALGNAVVWLLLACPTDHRRPAPRHGWIVATHHPLKAPGE
ncbi:hypothetical protein [Pseudofrankia asymbiotica]|uniref:hypothetical protein n=1 Tax=Pseudofrankia asymbiotica TaxID=1834516 RepID=UPI0013040E1E|nr:hypothetical protein [Pseudofrankia asymbiotica]